jgi:hypothetical protein
MLFAGSREFQRSLLRGGRYGTGVKELLAGMVVVREVFYGQPINEPQGASPNGYREESYMTICAYKMTWVAAYISLTAVVLPNTGASAMEGGVGGVSGVAGVGAGPSFGSGSRGGAHGVVRSHPGRRGTVHRGARRPGTVPARQ